MARSPRIRAKTVPLAAGLTASACKRRVNVHAESSGDEARQDAWSIRKGERPALGNHFVGSVGSRSLKQYLDEVGPDADEGRGRCAYRSVQQTLLITSPAGYLCGLARPTSVTGDQ